VPVRHERNLAREFGQLHKYGTQLEASELLLIDDLFLRKLPAHACDEPADVLMSRYEKASTIIITSNGLVYDWTQLLGDVVVVTRLLDRLMHHGYVLKFEGKSWRLKEVVAKVAKHTSFQLKSSRPAVGLEKFDPATGGALGSPPGQNEG
jgi:DNA replication protein DnaC